MGTRLSRIRKLRRAMREATSYPQWLEAAEELDVVEGNDGWREDDASQLYHHALLREHLEQMRQLRRKADGPRLISLLQESLHRHLGEISNPALYHYAHAGTKRLISDYLGEAAETMRLLCRLDIPGLSDQQKLATFERASHNFGRSALILSGGMSFGVYHLGVVKALWSEGLLPDVVSGSSMGSIVAAGICSRTDAELKELFSVPQTIHRQAMRFASPLKVLRQRHLMDQAQLAEHIRANVGRLTFREAFERTGRVLNITVSPTRSRQKPRVLNHLTAPEVMVDRSALASCAMPFGFPPVMLTERDRQGAEVSYMPTERWIDGSLHGDIPRLRLGRLHNVNHSIVSQANPHVLPFIPRPRASGLLSLGWQTASSVSQAQMASVLGISQHLVGGSWRPLVAQAHAVTTQPYLGDINIQFPFKPALYRKVFANPDLEGLERFIRLGEQATWPQMAIVRDQTLLSRTFVEVIRDLGQRVRVAGAEQAEPRRGTPRDDLGVALNRPWRSPSDVGPLRR